MVNRANAAEARLYDLLEQKLSLFDGVFGASDEVLGALESGVDFERRVLDIYQGCRSETEIDQAFQKLRGELESKISSRMQETRELLLERLDAEVRSRLRIAVGAAKAAVKRQEDDARQLALSVLGKENVAASGDMLHVRALPQALVDAAEGQLEPGLYSFGDAKDAEAHGAKKLGPHSPLVKAAARAVRARDAGLSFLNLDGSRAPSALVPVVGKEGYWFVYRVELGALEPEDRLLHLVLVRENGVYRPLDAEAAALFAELPARETIRRPEAGGQAVTAVQDQALERLLAKLKAEFEKKRSAALDKIHEKWDRFTEESLVKGRGRLAEAKEKWETGRKAVLAATDDAERAKLRRSRDLAEREYRRRLDQLRLEEQRRYADKERALAEAQRKAGAGEVRKTLVASSYWFLR